MKYKKKPVIIEAIEWTGKNEDEIKNFVGVSAKFRYCPIGTDATLIVSEKPKGSAYIPLLSIHTLEGEISADLGDYIIKGIHGEFYPCKPDIFGKTYDKADNSNVMDFGSAIEVLKQGKAIRRKGWNGKGMFVVKQIPAHITEDIIPKMQSLPQSAKDLIMARENKYINYTNQMLIINQDGRADSWVPSLSDIFAEDWEVVL